MSHTRKAWIAAVAALFFAMHSTAFRGEQAKVAKHIDRPASRCAAIDRNPASTRDEVLSCRLEREGSDRRLFARAISPTGDPVLEAKRAANAGDFRLMGYSTLVPGMFPAAYGVACQPSIVSQQIRMVRALYLASDVPPISKAEAINRQQAREAHRSIGERYNATLIADIRSPFRKMCRVVARDLEIEGGLHARKAGRS